MPRVKGIWMPSYNNQEVDRKPVLTWPPGAQSRREKLRHLRERVRNIIDSHDARDILHGTRILRLVKDEPDPEFAALHLFCAALDASEDTGEPWHVCAEYLVDKYETEAKEPDASETLAPVETGSRLRRLLRALVPRPFRSSHASTETICEHQQSGDDHGQSETGKDDRDGPNDPGGTPTSEEGPERRA